MPAVLLPLAIVAGIMLIAGWVLLLLGSKKRKPPTSNSEES